MSANLKAFGLSLSLNQIRHEPGNLTILQFYAYHLDMPLSKKRDAARKRNERAVVRGIQPSPTQLVEALSPNQRKERLAELISTPIEPEKVSPFHIISAIDIYNKMDRIYDDRTPAGPTIVNSFTFILPDGTKVSPKQLKEGNQEVQDAIKGQRKAEGIQQGADEEGETG